MARMEVELPTELMKVFEDLGEDTQKMLEEMTQEGAKTVLANVNSNVPASFHNSGIMRCLKITRPYYTPSDGGRNTKVAFYGYFDNEDGKKTPAPLVCNLFEYGRSKSPYPRHPFMRKSFKKGQIEAAMMKVQDRYIKGD
nr:MAG TPA: hypothetical protein [Caudoviricetes sp.]